MSLRDVRPGAGLSARDLRDAGRRLDAQRLAPASSLAGGSAVQVAGGAASVAPDTGWFTAKITGSVTGGYTFEEWAPNTSGTVAKVEGGRFNSSNDPAVPVDGRTLAADDYVLARRCPAAAGLRWEIAADSSGGSIDSDAWDSASSFAVTGSGSWVDAGGTFNDFTLPAAGDYLLYAHFYGTALISAFPPGLVNGRFYDETAAAAAGKAALVVAAQTVGPTYYVTTTLLTRYTASGANTIRLEFSRNTATFSGSTVQAVEYGYVKVG